MRNVSAAGLPARPVPVVQRTLDAASIKMNAAAAANAAAATAAQAADTAAVATSWTASASAAVEAKQAASAAAEAAQTCGTKEAHLAAIASAASAARAEEAAAKMGNAEVAAKLAFAAGSAVAVAAAAGADATGATEGAFAATSSAPNGFQVEEFVAAQRAKASNPAPAFANMPALTPAAGIVAGQLPSASVGATSGSGDLVAVVGVAPPASLADAAPRADSPATTPVSRKKQGSSIFIRMFSSKAKLAGGEAPANDAATAAAAASITAATAVTIPVSASQVPAQLPEELQHLQLQEPGLSEEVRRVLPPCARRQAAPAFHVLVQHTDLCLVGTGARSSAR